MKERQIHVVLLPCILHFRVSGISPLHWISPCVKMAYAVCMTAKVGHGGTVVFSRVATLSLTSDFASDFIPTTSTMLSLLTTKYPLDDNVCVSSGAQGPWHGSFLDCCEN